jgi:16S rRNA (cytosine1402-N4)-methyltransferase
VDGVLFDLGVSSMQLDRAERGFAYARDAPLDMRMDPTEGQTAADVLNTYPPGELVRILREYGEERFAQRIVRAVVAERERSPFDRSERLVRLLYDAVPAASRRTGGHPAKRTFQALRIEVNGELDTLRAALPAALGALAVGGRIVVESYHSLEDRMVKQALAPLARSRTPPGLPVELPGHGPELKLLTRGAEMADETEIEQNSRAASVRLRAAERIAETARP